MNIAKLKAQAQADMEAWDSAAAFDTEKDKKAFRDYEAACDRVKSFYKVCFHPCSSVFSFFSRR